MDQGTEATRGRGTRSNVEEGTSDARDRARCFEHKALSHVMAGDDDEDQDAADRGGCGDCLAQLRSCSRHQGL